MDIVDVLLGKPLATEDERGERIGPVKGIPIFGLDALSSAAYGPEAAMTLLIPLGIAGFEYTLPIVGAILLLLTIVYFSYRQTMQAYPHGGGSYTVASENLGTNAGLLAAAALMLDYVLTAAVGISAGVGALVSAAPSLQKHTLAMCLGILFVLAFVNLRGMQETGGIFMIPTYLFIACLLGMIAVGVAKAFLAGGHPVPVVSPPRLGPATEAMGVWLMLRAFSSGCTAMTGVEAVSNGVMAFREPTTRYAQRTLTVIIAILMVMLLGIAYLAPVYGVAATVPDGPGYESVLSQLLGAITGKGAFYWVAITSILAVLSLSANTAFADFPRLARAIAQNGFLPNSLKLRGRRLVYSQGIYALAILAGVLLTIFGGVTDRLIPLYAVGAFLAFTLSQAGMVIHWRRNPGPGAARSMFVNGLGAAATAVTVVVVLIAKFIEGAWIVVVLIPTIILLMKAVEAHYKRVERATRAVGPVSTAALGEPIVILPVEQWNAVSEKALRFAWQMSSDIRMVHVDCGEEDTADLRRDFPTLIEGPARAAGLAVPQLVVVESPYRFIVRPILNYTSDLEKANPDRTISVLIPELVESRWYYMLLHNNRSEVLKALLTFTGCQRTTIVNIPWQLPD